MQGKHLQVLTRARDPEPVQLLASQADRSVVETVSASWSQMLFCILKGGAVFDLLLPIPGTQYAHAGT